MEAASATLPDRERLEALASRFPTPFYLYDEASIRSRARHIRSAFAWVEAGFTNYFAVKALPNPHIMRILREEGMGFDCSSLPELLLAEWIGATGGEITFTSNDTPAHEFRKAIELGALINLDDIGHIDYLHHHAGMPEFIGMRYNPGSLKRGNRIIGRPEEAKYGATREQLFEGYPEARRRGARRFGLHTMVASNELDEGYFVETADLLFGLSVEMRRRIDIDIELINLGGGIGIPYRPEQRPVDFDRVSDGIREVYERRIVPAGLAPLRIVMENGRAITGPCGWLIARVRHLKQTYRSYIGLDATMANLMRPGMYGAWHRITVPGKDNLPAERRYDVTGSLCENNDKFAIDRLLPPVERGDLVAIHDAGAHGHAMGFNYNGKLRCAEVLLRTDGEARLIRRPETLDDYFATLDCAGL